MYSHFMMLFLFIVLFTSTTSAPTDSHPASSNDIGLLWKEVKNCSRKLTEIAKEVAYQVDNGEKYDNAQFSISPSWIEAKDQCHPEGLNDDPKPCVMKIFAALNNYSSTIKTVERNFKSCSHLATRVRPAVDNLLEKLNRVASILFIVQESNSDPGPADHFVWKEHVFCHYTLNRLFSFSIFTSRVFAMGDPVLHKKTTHVRCA